ncbi:MAG: methyltransferase domain-containing protein [Candidatus Moranbacteria bacterium]|nr:methyltransferase domain-containing protein [Candidatus Moranbacteria bacterium]
MGSGRFHEQNQIFQAKSGIKKILALLPNLTKIKTVLDLGCGRGAVSAALVKKGLRVFGVDVNHKALKEARKRGLKVKKADLETGLPFKKFKFDLILANDIIEHIYDWQGLAQELNRVLRPAGKIIIVTPNHFDIRSRLAILGGRGIVHWSSRQWTTAAQYGHIRFLKLQELEAFWQAQGFYPHKRRFNYMAGGLLPQKLTPKWLRKRLLKAFPELLSGKYGLLLGKYPTQRVETVYLPETVQGM